MKDRVIHTTVQLLADALCAREVAENLHDGQHLGQRYRGIEGLNGTACDRHREEAEALAEGMEHRIQHLRGWSQEAVRGYPVEEVLWEKR